jgi:two-component system alkaline phosphatase synthesis response regulator PhoP
MATVLILSRNSAVSATLSPPLKEAGYATAILSEPSELPALTVEEFPDIVLLDVPWLRQEEKTEAIDFCRSANLPILALLRTIDIASGHAPTNIDDFLIEPPNSHELITRVHQLIRRLRGRDGQQILRVGDLLIDQSRYEVTLAGRKVILTFKEYELLRLLASAPGRVFKREELLTKIWEYDYFGGTRTVDVHIRRLRSKVEDAHHNFIETVWNVGYRIKDSEN